MINSTLEQFCTTVQVNDEPISLACTEIYIPGGSKFFISGNKNDQSFGFEMVKRKHEERWKIGFPRPLWAPAIEGKLSNLLASHH